MNNSTEAQVAGGIALLVLAIVILAIGPLFALWSWNQLFGEFKTFDYNFWNWAAVIGIGTVFKTIQARSGK